MHVMYSVWSPITVNYNISVTESFFLETKCIKQIKDEKVYKNLMIFLWLWVLLCICSLFIQNIIWNVKDLCYTFRKY